MNTALLIATATTAQIDPVSGLAQTLQSYGAWGLSAILMLSCAYLFKKYVEARDKNEATLTAQVQGAVQLVEEATTAAVEQRKALDDVAKALTALERRLEYVEKG